MDVNALNADRLDRGEVRAKRIRERPRRRPRAARASRAPARRRRPRTLRRASAGRAREVLLDLPGAVAADLDRLEARARPRSGSRRPAVASVSGEEPPDHPDLHGCLRGGACAAGARAPRSGSRSAPRPCGGCRSPGRARGRARPSGRGGCARRARRRAPAALPGDGKSSTTHRRRRRRAAPAPARRAARPANSTQIASAWPTITGTRTHVAWIGSSGSSMIFCVSSTELGLLVELLAVEVPVHAQVVLRLRLVAQPLHRLGAGAGDRLVGGDADPHETCFVVQRLEDGGERDRAAVRVRDDPVVLERAAAVHLGHDQRVSPAPDGTPKTCRSPPLRPSRRAGRARATQSFPPRRETRRCRRATSASGVASSTSNRPSCLPAERADAKTRTLS